MTLSLRLLMGLFLAVILAIEVTWLDRKAFGPRALRKGPHYTFSLAPVLIVYWAALLLGTVVLNWGDSLTDALFSLWLILFFQLSLYNLLLLALMPLLRRWFKPQTCALLWLLPIYLYVLQYDAMAPSRPRLVLQVPDLPIGAILLVWVIGFAAVLGWKIFSHIRFRRSILAGARPVDDPAMVELWRGLQARLNPHEDKCYPLVISPRVQSPLSVGLWSIHVVLPEHAYSPEQLSLILKHELIHILRRDSLSKFFFVTCTALCWFNPLMWLAMDRSAQDMELSCDEAVLFDADPDTRRTYAGLLLDTAGDSRGFTTCLSASASSLRYRLKRIVKPTRRLAGSLLAGAAAFGLVMTSGFVSLAYETTPAAELLFSSGSQEDYALRSVALTAPSSPESQWSCTNPEALMDYLADLEGRKITGGYTLSDATHQLSIRYADSQRSYRVVLADDYLICRPRSSSVAQEGVYLISGGVDWDVLTGLLEPEPPLQ